MENLLFEIGYFIQYNFGTFIGAILILILVAIITYGYFYIKKLKKAKHSKESLVSYYKKQSELRKEIIFDARQDLAETEELCFDLQQALWDKKVDAILLKYKK